MRVRAANAPHSLGKVDAAIMLAEGRPVLFKFSRRFVSILISRTFAIALLAGPMWAGISSAGETVGGDGSEIELEELAQGDIEGADLSGELACSFSTGDTPAILYATGIVGSDEPAQGVVKVSGYVEPIAAPGGFEGITDDPIFSGQGKMIEIAVTGPAIGGGESPPRPATLTYQRADGASRVFEGLWRCGP